MHTNNPHNPIYRALVTYSSATTGEIRIKIPSLIGVDSEVYVSYIGRSSPTDNYWVVPKIGEQIVVTTDDSNLTNIFWVQTDPGVLTAVDGFYGAFSDYTDQFSGGSSTIGGAIANKAAPMRFTTTDEANGVSIVNNSRITFEHSGVYNLQWSGQFENTDNAPHDANVWLSKNGSLTGVVGSNGRISLAARKNATEFSHTLSGWNFVLTVAAGDFYEFIWSADSVLVSIQTFPITLLPTRPSTASLVLTVTPVTKVQTGATGPAGPDFAAQFAYKVGDTGPGGGTIFFVDRFNEYAGFTYLEAAPVDVQVQRTWAPTAYQTTAVTGADSKALGGGYQNTLDIIAQGHTDEATSAAKYCDALVYGGKSDWFLPSLAELVLIHTVIHLNTGTSYSDTSDSWSSTEHAFNGSSAWVQQFGYGFQNFTGKNSNLRTRPIRMF